MRPYVTRLRLLEAGNLGLEETAWWTHYSVVSTVQMRSTRKGRPYAVSVRSGRSVLTATRITAATSAKAVPQLNAITLPYD